MLTCPVRDRCRCCVPSIDQVEWIMLVTYRRQKKKKKKRNYRHIIPIMIPRSRATKEIPLTFEASKSFV